MAMSWDKEELMQVKECSLTIHQVSVIFSMLFQHIKTHILGIILVLLGIMIFCGLYIIGCHISPVSTATYCVKTQCISIVEIYKGGGVNAVPYIRIYEKRIFFRFQLEMNNYISFLTPFGEMDETEDIHISEKLFNNKIVVKAISPIKTNGSVENIKL
ncbi:MAG: hypothetical protein J6M43_07485 [Neisseriaceae bacterium]|nr:hypothetical protein [Neisseriaceae bacterium]